jgi:hypothetical protein
MVSMTLNAHEIPMPGEAAPLLDIRVGQGLTLLPAARLAKELVA